MQRRPSKPRLVTIGLAVAAATLAVVSQVAVAAAQVDQGESEVVNIRATDERLGPLVFLLVGLGCMALASTMIFWWLTRPGRLRSAQDGKPTIQGDG